MPRVTGQERLFNSIGSSYLSTDTISIKNSPGETNWVTRCQTGNPGLLTIMPWEGPGTVDREPP